MAIPLSLVWGPRDNASLSFFKLPQSPQCLNTLLPANPECHSPRRVSMTYVYYRVWNNLLITESVYFHVGSVIGIFASGLCIAVPLFKAVVCHCRLPNAARVIPRKLLWPTVAVYWCITSYAHELRRYIDVIAIILDAGEILILAWISRQARRSQDIKWYTGSYRV